MFVACHFDFVCCMEGGGGPCVKGWLVYFTIIYLSFNILPLTLTLIHSLLIPHPCNTLSVTSGLSAIAVAHREKRPSEMAPTEPHSSTYRQPNLPLAINRSSSLTSSISMDSSHTSTLRRTPGPRQVNSLTLRTTNQTGTEAIGCLFGVYNGQKSE